MAAWTSRCADAKSPPATKYLKMVTGMEAVAGASVTRSLAFLVALALLTVPVVAADPGNGSGDGQGGNGHSQGHDTNQTSDGDHGERQGQARHCGPQRDDGPERGTESPQGNGTAQQSIVLNAAPGSLPSFNWTEQGLDGQVCGYKIYRSDPINGEHLIATVDSSTRSYQDTSAPSGMNEEYFVQGLTPHNQNVVRSNSIFAYHMNCAIVSVDPFGNPPVLYHLDCLPPLHP
jgi:hypothetical protein